MTNLKEKQIKIKMRDNKIVAEINNESINFSEVEKVLSNIVMSNEMNKFFK